MLDAKNLVYVSGDWHAPCIRTKRMYAYGAVGLLVTILVIILLLRLLGAV